jgi:hypothetical protein
MPFCGPADQKSLCRGTIINFQFCVCDICFSQESG